MKEKMQDIAKSVASHLPPETLFVVLVFERTEPSSPAHYVSNGNREDIWRAVGEWLLNTNHRPLGDS